MLSEFEFKRTINPKKSYHVKARRILKDFFYVSKVE